MRKILFVCSFMFTLYSYGHYNFKASQQQQQNIRLFLVGDQKGNNPVTVNFLSKVEIPVYNLKKNHLSTYISLEYADLVEKYYQVMLLE